MLRNSRFWSFVMTTLFFFSASGWAAGFHLSGSRHADGRDTPKLEFPAAAAAKTASPSEFLKTQSARFKIPADLSNLELVGVRHSLIGAHTRYRQLLNGLPVEGAEIIVSQRKTDGSVFQVYNNTYPVESPVPVAKNRIGPEAALQKAWDQLRVHGSLTALPKADLLYVPGKSGFRLVYKTLICVTAPYGFWEHKVDAASGEILSVRRHEISEKHAPTDVPDFSLYRGPTTSLPTERGRFETALAAASKEAPPAAPKATANGTALVFDPDPRTALNNAALVDSSAAAAFNAAYVTRSLLGITSNAGVYSLVGPYVTVTNMASELPATAVSTSTSGSWTNRRGNNGFNDVMCYFHIDQNQRYLQSLGYSGSNSIQAVSIPVDSDGVDGEDNSHYVPSQNSLAFGHGGVDDDEDADVILHEYGHALTYDTSPSFGGGDSGAIGEGFGDYWGASYSWTCTNGSTFNPAWAFSWDGHSADSWAGRFLDMTNLTYDHSVTYDAHVEIAGIANYSDQLWGTPIYMAFRDLIAAGRPREEMDTIIIESFFGIGADVKMRDLANATVAAATELYPAGPHAAAYYNRFAAQLILLPPALPDPVLTFPAGGETFSTGAVVNVLWDRNGAPAAAAAVIEYNSRVSGGTTYFFDQIESGTNGWVRSKTAGSDWYITNSASHSPSRSWFAANNTTTGDQFLARSAIAVSNNAVLSFWHSYDLESGYDGAVVEISTNGSTWLDLGTNATQNGYNSTISSSYGSSLGGRRAFSGSSGGFVETKIPLTAYAGKFVSIRFREADDDGNAESGWWVDDIQIAIEVPWVAVATTPTNTSSYSWTLPGATGTNYGVRVKLAAAGYSDSGWSTSPAFTLVVAAPNHAPTNILLSGTNVAENAAVGTLVGSFGSQDPDPGNTFTYSLAAGTGDANNGSFSLSGSNLLAAASFNYEVQSNYSIRVQSTDQGGLSTQKVFAIRVLDVSETPPSFSGIAAPDGSHRILSWSSLTNHTYTIYISTNLLNGFTVLQSNIPATPNFNSYTDSVLSITQKYWIISTDP